MPYTVAIHQPNYLPWLGFFYKIYLADQFILLDDVPYSKGSFTARTYYRKQAGKQEKAYLSVPLRKTNLGTPICLLELDRRQEWSQKHLNQIQNTYRSAEQFDQYFPMLKDWMETGSKMTNLADWNIFLIRQLNGLLGIETPLVRSNTLKPEGQRTQYLIDLIREVKGERYLSGAGGRNYQDENLFAEAEIQLQYLQAFAELDQIRYPQAEGDWLNGLSIIDALLNIGPEGIMSLFSRLQG